MARSCELLSDFVYSFFEHNLDSHKGFTPEVVNCFQILYIRSLNTIPDFRGEVAVMLWIAFRFCIFVLWTQWCRRAGRDLFSCELLSDFVYSFFEHNDVDEPEGICLVVNCFQILYIRSLNTIGRKHEEKAPRCELLSDFVYSFFEHNQRQRLQQ